MSEHRVWVTKLDEEGKPIFSTRRELPGVREVSVSTTSIESTAPPGWRTIVSESFVLSDGMPWPKERWWKRVFRRKHFTDGFNSYRVTEN